MQESGLFAFALLLLGFGLVSKRLESSVLTGPMVFAAFGFATGPAGLGLFDLDLGGETLHVLAEATLALVLFADAAAINLKALRRGFHLPLRLLGVGLPLTIAAGTIVSRWIFPELGWPEAALLATILAPTDAALGQAVVSSPRVPQRIRQALNVESGLNDGICLPFVMLFLALSLGETERTAAGWAQYAAGQLALGPLVGVGVGWAGAKAIERATAAEWMNDAFRRLSALGLAMLAYVAAEAVGGNGFIATFAAGLTLGATERKDIAHQMLLFAETEGQLLGLSAFAVFGASNVAPALEQAGPAALLLAALSLTVLRMGPVSLSLLGARLRPPTHVFLGWFGPRGLASILYVLLALEEGGPPGAETIFAVVMTTVLLSVVLHGVTAAPAAEWYADRVASLAAHRPGSGEMTPVEEMPVRMPFRGVRRR